jgi:osmotically inducible lipoprotein OsmB
MDECRQTTNTRQKQMFKTVVLVAVLSTTLAGCMANDAQRALIGAGVGAVAADATGNDPLLGAAGGAAVGLLIK